VEEKRGLSAGMRVVRLALVALLHAAGQAYGDVGESEALPSFAELEAAGAVVGAVRVDPRDIYDPSDPKENSRLYRLANRLHARTRPETVAQQLLFKTGDRVSVRAIAETERLLRGNRYLHDVEIRPAAYRDGVVDIDVITRDSWTLDPGLSIARAGGVNSSRAYVNEKNLLGRGVSVGLMRSTNVEHAGTQLSYSDKHLFGTWASLDASVGKLTDGSQWSLAFGRPFYAADTPWAAGFSGSRSDVVNSIFDRGERVAAYRARQDAFRLSAGISATEAGGPVQRYSAGFDYQGATYAAQAGVPAPDPLPQDRVVSGPFVGYDVLNESYEKVVNRDQIGRTEYFALGTKAGLQLGRSLTNFGATVDGWIVSLNASRGTHLFQSHSLLASASLAGRLEQSQRQNQLFSASVRYFIPQRHDAVFAASASVDVYRHPDTTAPLQLGGDTGLRGYPLSFQSGERRALFTVEERVYTDWYPYRTVRVAAAVFADAGRAWHGTGEQSAGERVLTDAGIGLRFQNPRSATGTVVHTDLAFPVNARNEIKSVQFLLKSATSF
jgi:outer membrane protein assembly factor BamA